MNIRDYIVFYSVSQVKNPTEVSTNNHMIVIPEFFEETLTQMTQSSIETFGSFLGYKTNKRFFVENMMILGHGDRSSVYPDVSKIINREKIKQRFSGLESIDFHTHHKNLDAVYFNSFSNQDIQQITIGVNEKPDYQHILITPTSFGIFSINLPKIVFANDHFYEQLHEQLSRDLLIV